jgi:hypothetical protein
MLTVLAAHCGDIFTATHLGKILQPFPVWLLCY